jgi:hypothetical protein
MNTYTDLLVETLIAAPNERMEPETLQMALLKIQSQPTRLHGQQKLNMNVDIGKKIKNIQSSIHTAMGQRQLLVK